MRSIIKSVSKEWKIFYTIVLMGLVAVLIISIIKAHFGIGDLLIQLVLLSWYVAILITTIYITIKRFERWEKSIFTYGGSVNGFLEIEKGIDILRDGNCEEECVYHKINKIYEDLKGSLSEFLERQNYIRNRLKLTGEILQLILNIGIAVIFGILPELSKVVASNFSVALHIIVSFFVVFMCIITFPTSIVDPEYSKVQAIYEYEEKRLEEEIYKKQKNL